MLSFWYIYQLHRKEGFPIALTNASLPAKRRILTVCVRLFLEQGYRKTTVAEIIREASVSASTFQNIFRAKDGVLTELVEFMFSNQFSMAHSTVGKQLPPIYIYAVETAIQLTLTELNENLREIYGVAYTKPLILDSIVQQTAQELQTIFSPYLPGLTYTDFYHLDIGTSGVMRSYMLHPCDENFTLEKKLRDFLSINLRAYNVPAEEVEKAIAFVESLDIREIAQQVMEKLLKDLQMRYDFTLPEASDAQNAK